MTGAVPSAGGTLFPSIQGSGAEAFFHEPGAPHEGDEPHPPASNWTTLVTQLSKVERSKFELLRRSSTEKLELEQKLEKMIVERDERARLHAREIGLLKQTAEKQVRDAVNKLRKELYICDEKRKRAETRAADSEVKRAEALQNVQTLERRIRDLLLSHSQKEHEAQSEISRVKGERDASYQRTQTHAEERVKAMCTMAREAQDAMYRNMESLEVERERLTVRARRQSGLGMLGTDYESGDGGRQAGMDRQASMASKISKSPSNMKSMAFYNPYGARMPGLPGVVDENEE